MPKVDENADIYADKRLNIFFPGVVPSLDGQCVSLVKWFMAEMSEAPNPQAARGDARWVGKTLVAQGHAVEVPYTDRRRGDLVCYEYGQYGHIGVVLSSNRTFEENVNWPGVPSKIVDKALVYASRIGNLSEAWRHDMHIYRLKSYNEGGSIMEPSDYRANNGDNTNVKEEFGYKPGDPPNLDGQPWKSIYYNWISGKGRALRRRIAELEAELANSGGSYTEVTDITYKGQKVYTKN